MTTNGQDSQAFDRGIGPNGLPPGPWRTKTAANQVLYRICTEDVPSFSSYLVGCLADNGFTGCTVVACAGLWKGDPERSAIVEIVADASDADRIRSFALQLGQLGHQDSVLVQSIPLAHCEFVKTAAPVSQLGA